MTKTEVKLPNLEHVFVNGRHIEDCDTCKTSKQHFLDLSNVQSRAIATLPELVQVARQTVQLDHAGMPAYMRKQLAELRRILAHIDSEERHE